MSFGDRMKELFDEGVQVSKDFLNKAGAKVQEMGEIGVLRLEIKQLEGQAQKQIGQLGVEAYKAFVERGAKTISIDTPAVKTILAELDSIQQSIEQREDQIKQKNNKPDSPDNPEVTE